MSQKTHKFKTEVEANAFVDGVEWVNDSDIRFLGVVERPDDTLPWWACFDDAGDDDE